MEENEDYRPRKRKGKKFWSFQRIAFLIVFLVGFALGMYVTNQFIDPALDSSTSAQNEELLQINQELDSVNDQYYSCLQTFEIDPATCTK